MCQERHFEKVDKIDISNMGKAALKSRQKSRNIMIEQY